MPATWTLGTTITITGTGNTLTSITADINNTTVISGVSSGIWEVDGIKGRYINISAGGELIIGDPNDFSVSEVLRHKYSGTVSTNRLNVYEGGMFKMYGNSQCILNYNCTSAQYPDYAYFIGNVHIEGDDTYQPILKGARHFQFICTPANETYFNNSELYLYKCKIGETAGTYVIYLYIQGEFWKTFKIDTVTFINDLYTSNEYGIHISLLIPIDNYPPITNLINGTSSINTFRLTYANVSGYFKDIIWITTNATYAFYITGNVRSTEYFPTYDWSITDSQKESKKAGQWIDCFLDNVDIQTTYAYQMYFAGNCQAVVKNCPNTNNKSNLIYTGAIVLCWNSDNIFDRLTLDNIGGMGKKVFLLDLTINDQNGDPVSDCYVRVGQKDDNEFFLCRTDINGKIIALYGLGGLLLANSIRRTSSETLEYWSDDSNSTYHTITVLKEGYFSYTENVVMDADKTVIITLKSTTKPYYLSTTGDVLKPIGNQENRISLLQRLI